VRKGVGGGKDLSSPAISKVCSIPGVIYVITSAAQCLLALPGHQQELEWSRPTGPSSLQMLVYFSWYIDITNQNTVSPSITPRCSKTFWRNGEAESKGETEVLAKLDELPKDDFDSKVLLLSPTFQLRSILLLRPIPQVG
jgi:hypothetical protein